VFIDIDPSFWVAGARQTREGGRNPEDGVPQIINAKGEQAKPAPELSGTATEVPKFLVNSLA
jgi:1,4-alpha-glucan branching enzyme